MNFRDSARYVLAILVIASFPPSLLLWLAIHPFAAFWRRVGAVWTYVILGFPVVGYMVGVWLFRKTLLVLDLEPTCSLSFLPVLHLERLSC